MTHINRPINGPINVVRLEGKVNGINKVIYTFMDIHMSPNRQTECKDIRSVDIKNFFINSFDGLQDSEKTYDFLVEYFPTDLPKTERKSSHTLYRDIYLTQIRKLFQAGVNIKKDKIMVSKEFPNIRFHYLDIRDYTKLFLCAVDKLDSFMSDVWHRGPRSYDIPLIKDSANIITSQGKFLYDLFFNGTKKASRSKPIIPETAQALSKYTEKDINENARYIINKIKEDFQHDNIKKIIHKIINTTLKHNFHNFFAAAKDLDSYIMKNKDKIEYPRDKIYTSDERGSNWGYSESGLRKIAYEVHKLERKYNWQWFLFHTCIMDLYFLRRYLDKKYITNAITYTGAAHSVNYVYMLVKYFNFKITHASYMKHNISKTTDIIKKSKRSIDVEHLFYPPRLVQCSNLKDFPKMFD